MTAKSILQIIAFSVLLTMAIPLLSMTHSPYPIVHASSKTIYLVANNIGGYLYWNSSNPTIAVTQGDTITLHLSSNTASIAHTFWLDLDGDTVSDMSDCSPTIDPCISTPFTTPQTLTFTASTVGTFLYFCTIHYPSMTGNFVVQAPPPPNFSIASNPSSMTFLQGSSGTSTITVTSQNGFSGTVSLSAISSPTGLSTSFKPSPVMVSPGTPQTSILSVNSTISTPTRTYMITVTGTNGTLGPSHTTNISVTIISPNFSVTASPASIGVIQGTTGNKTTITLASLHSYAGTVTLSATSSQTGLLTIFNPTSVTLTSGGSGISAMTVSTSSTRPGFYSITVNGTSGTTTNSTTLDVTVTIPDFRLNPNPISLSLTQGSSATTTITMTSLSEFKGTLTLTGTISPSGPSVSFNPASVALTSGGSITSVMTVSTSGSVGTGSYTVTVTVTNGTLTHSTTVPLAIASNQASLPVALLIGVGIGAAVVVGVAVLFFRRRTKQV